MVSATDILHVVEVIGFVSRSSSALWCLRPAGNRSESTLKRF